MRITGIKNPVDETKDFALVKVKMMEINIASEKKIIYKIESEYPLFLSLKSTPLPDTTSVDANDYVKFESGSIVTDTNKTLSHKCKTMVGNFNVGDYYLTFLPTELTGLEDN